MLIITVLIITVVGVGVIEREGVREGVAAVQVEDRGQHVVQQRIGLTEVVLHRRARQDDFKTSSAHEINCMLSGMDSEKLFATKIKCL